VSRVRSIAERLSWLIVAGAAAGCDPHVVVGADPADGDEGPSLDGNLGPADGSFAPLIVPWSTGFETGLGDWTQSGEGACYFLGGGTFRTVTSPVHSGAQAAAFTVNPSAAGGADSEARCYRQGILPPAAYYGAWYYVPAPAFNAGNWNLFHFRGGSSTLMVQTHGLWDVSLLNDPDGGNDTSVFDFFQNQSLEAGSAIPIAQWFHLEVYFKRSDAGAGEFTVYRDQQVVFHQSGITTDDSLVGSWHVGNLATSLFPPVSTIYVDDVTIDTKGP
jgi:hypothetical protein